MNRITGHSAVVTGSGPLADGLVRGLADVGVGAMLLDCEFSSEAAVGDSLAHADRVLDGIDQIVHTWLAPGMVTAHAFMDLDEDAWAAGCEHSLEAAWWLARR